MITAGMDAGSRTIKLVLWDAEKKEMLAFDCRDQGVAQEALANDLLDAALARAGIGRNQVSKIVATGYGRNLLRFADTTVTEITCHARGVRHLMPGARTIVEIGGQDSKLIRLEPGGAVRDFAMNDRCAAGTGRFLEMVSQRVSVPMADLGALACRSCRPAAISSMCVVFAETEIIGLLASGTPPEDIVAGIQSAVASRVSSMAGGKVEHPVVFTGGVALVTGMSDALQSVLQCPVQTVPTPLLTGALGAALIAAG